MTKNEERIIDPNTGGEKCAKSQRLSLIPPEALMELAEHYHKNTSKYPPYNWRRGYAWSLSYDALQRHLHAFWSGEDYDPDSPEGKSKHMTAAAWHCITLMTFMEDHPDKDDRYKKPSKHKPKDSPITCPDGHLYS